MATWTFREINSKAIFDYYEYGSWYMNNKRLCSVLNLDEIMEDVKGQSILDTFQFWDLDELMYSEWFEDAVLDAFFNPTYHIKFGNQNFWD